MLLGPYKLPWKIHGDEPFVGRVYLHHYAKVLRIHCHVPDLAALDGIRHIKRSIPSGVHLIVVSGNWYLCFLGVAKYRLISAALSIQDPYGIISVPVPLVAFGNDGVRVSFVSLRHLDLRYVYQSVPGEYLYCDLHARYDRPDLSRDYYRIALFVMVVIGLHGNSLVQYPDSLFLYYDFLFLRHGDAC